MSSPVIANCVFATISPSAARGNTADHPEPGSGTVGKSSRGNVCIRESNCAAATSTAPFAPCWMRISVSGRARTISKSFFAGMVSEPRLADLRRAPAAEPDLEVRREHLQAAVAVRLEQDVPQDRDRVLALDDSLEELQLAKQVALSNAEFHGADNLGSTSRETSGPES